LTAQAGWGEQIVSFAEIPAFKIHDKIKPKANPGAAKRAVKFLHRTNLSPLFLPIVCYI
jgi:hypothetical protein